MKLEYRVSYKENDQMITKKFESFASAAGCADALNGMTRLLDVNIVYGPGQEHSGTLYIYPKVGYRRQGSKYLIGLITKMILKGGK